MIKKIALCILWIVYLLLFFVQNYGTYALRLSIVKFNNDNIN